MESSVKIILFLQINFSTDQAEVYSINGKVYSIFERAVEVLGLSAAAVFSLIFDVKKSGKGRLGRSKIYVELMSIIADGEGSADISGLFGGSIDRFLLRLINGETEYPYKLFSFSKFEDNIGNINANYNYIALMKRLCDKALDESKIQPLIYTLLEMLRQDETETILYGGKIIPKSELFGSYSHPKNICLEALLLGVLYQVHKYPKTGSRIQLSELPDRIKFRVLRYTDPSSLELDTPVNMADSIAENSTRSYVLEGSETRLEREYELEMYSAGKPVSALPETGNVFLYGAGASGKTTIMLREINRSNSVKLYFPLYKYKPEQHGEFSPYGCRILVQILLKYFYQYEYLTFENACACEGKDEVLRRLTELESLLKPAPISGVPEYTLLLDGLNELTPESQEYLIDEIEYLCENFRNIQIVISGRTVPLYGVFDGFKPIEVCGVMDKERDEALSEIPNIQPDPQLLELLKTPLFLNMYVKSGSSELHTRGELLDAYIMGFQSKLPENSLLRFAVQFALPIAAKRMTDDFSYEIDRGDLSDSMDDAVSFYLMNERIFQNYIAPKNFRKKALLKSREQTDIVELLINNASFLAASKNEPQKLHFTHQYFRDYFAAKYVINTGDSLWTSFEYKLHDERTELFQRSQLDLMWFYSEDDIYRLIGEIAGDHRNVPADDFRYSRTVLDKILDLSRHTMSLHTAECVIKAMALTRGNILCGVDFSGQCLPVRIPGNVRFSMNGQYPCDFRYSWVFSLDTDSIIGEHFPDSETEFSPDAKREFFSQFDNFKNCDFTGAEFFDDESMEIIGYMGGLVELV